MTQVGSKRGQAAHTAGSNYADPGYQSDGLKRYPLDTPEHVRAALSYIGQARNAGKYTPGQLAKVKGAIYRAARAHGMDGYKAVADNAKGK
jgi:hypothetical protein